MDPAPSFYNAHFAAYGLGWFLRDTQGYEEVSHAGGLPGQIMQVILLPELQLGIVVLTKQETAAITAITNCIEDQYLGLGLTGPDCVQEVVDRMKARANGAGQATVAAYKQVALAQKAAPKRPDHSAYTDRYHDA